MTQYTINSATNEIWDDAGNRGIFAGIDPVYQAYEAWHQADPDNHQLITVYEPPAHTQEELTALIQQRLDAFAAEHGFSGILSACTYVSSRIPQFAADAARCVDLRDLTWATAYEIEMAVRAGQRPAPTWDELQTLLPALTWS